MQGLLGSFDIVISYNVIHTTESVMDSVVNLKSCLGDDGVLFIIESAKNVPGLHWPGGFLMDGGTLKTMILDQLSQCWNLRNGKEY